jgi:hypothetical protein
MVIGIDVELNYRRTVAKGDCSFARFFQSRPGASPGSRDIPPFLSVKLQCGQSAHSMPIAEECLNRRPEATFHNRVYLWQSRALEFRRDSSPMLFGLR